MALSAPFKRITRPGTLPIEIFIGGSGQSFQRDLLVSVGGVAENLTGVTPYAELRTLDDSLIVTMNAAVTDASAGSMSISMSRATADAIDWPFDGSILGQRQIRGRWHVRLDDGSTSAVILCGPATVTR